MAKQCRTKQSEIVDMSTIRCTCDINVVAAKGRKDVSTLLFCMPGHGQFAPAIRGLLAGRLAYPGDRLVNLAKAVMGWRATGHTLTGTNAATSLTICASPLQAGRTSAESLADVEFLPQL